MALAVASGAMMTCPFGVAPSTLTVLPAGRVMADGVPMATIMDHKPNVNIAPFGMCNSLANPQVAAATSAAQGVLTPQPCVPLIIAPWAPGSPTVSIGGQPALTNSSTCNCAWGGTITISNPGTTTSQVA
jgi:uncharacterized Zn-binding protein involved in type VI secretion